MGKRFFAFGIHNHQPVGNFDHVLEQAYLSAYRPFMEVLKNHPKMKMAFHCSGYLLEWMEKKYPEFFDTLAELYRRGQIEIFVSGFYEPILPAIPERDRVEQILQMKRFWKEKIGVPEEEMRGLWLTERVWEPGLVKSLVEAGIEYIVVDDQHFLSAGLVEGELTGYFITEDEGKPLKVFPISMRLRYLIPFGRVEEVLDYIRWFPEGSLLVMFDDGEKFGVWPNTHRHVFVEGWLHKFFSAIEKSPDIEPVLFSEWVRMAPPKGRVYLPTASYLEMTEWALPPRLAVRMEKLIEELKAKGTWEDLRPLIKGGFWRNFLAKYEEANALHKKMIYVSEKVGQSPSRKRNRAKKYLWMGQCNDAYWHGIFGGLYLPHLRRAVWRNLIAAENAVAKARVRGILGCFIRDYDCDGNDEVILETSTMNLYIKPSYGGAVFEWDIRKKGVNLADVLTRRREAYHEKLKEASKGPEGVKTIHEMVLSKEEGLEKLLFYDWYRRGVLQDHFFHPDTRLEDFYACRYGEQGDFINQPYEFRVSAAKERAKITLKRDGHVWVGEEFLPITVEKAITVTHAKPVRITYRITNKSDETINVWFGVEFNLGLQPGDNPDLAGIRFSRKDKFAPLRERLEATTKYVELFEKETDTTIRIRPFREALVWSFPIETVSMSEAGFERTFQGVSVTPSWKLTIPAGESVAVVIEIEIR